ncbi:NRDE family protein [Lacinutrix sp. C3R15]|uniref:NRDE family protein n=1 Tax=Flavobacteriaceae TaxID=49546 RepID=UPI001C084110|nr:MULTISPECIES: NRDE family protein [Flavobacteriaceae]MBU2939270.1 NRDE family protein [Lacinutrix sp. C3R15]MDO6622585.1 NRDE family protein [Oceanihabitans sp. 1_MG-2023]
MCTVTIFPTGENDFVLTSNRDEAPNRVSLVPDFYEVDAAKLLFPKDKKAGGTWIGVSDKNRLICLLNGGFKHHKRKESYRLSRGVVVKDLLASKEIVTAIEAYNFQDIEPFTLVIADWNTNLQFYELVWDGDQKHFKNLPKEAKIWSSSTLYSKAMKDERTQWFDDFKKGNKLNSAKALQFHKNTHINNKEYGVVMDRGFVKTTSITQVEKTKGVVSMCFENLAKNTKSLSTFLFTETVHE